MSSVSENNKRIAKNTIFLYIRMIVLIFVNFFTMRVVLQNLGVEDFGLYNVVAGFVSMIAFLNQAMTNSIQRFINFELGQGSEESLRKYYETALTTQLFLLLFVLFLAETVGLWFLNYRMNIPDNRIFAANFVYQCSIIQLCNKIFESPFNAIIIAKEKMNFYAIVSLIEGLFQLIIAYLISVSISRKLELYAVLLLTLSAVILLTKIVYSKRLISFLKIRFKYYRNIFREMISFSGWNLFGSAANVVQDQGINVLMNLFFGVAINAARGVAFQVSGCINNFVGNFQVAINPQIVQSYASKDFTRYKSLTFYSAKISFCLIWLFALPVLFCASELLHVWLGNNVPNYSVDFIRIILCSSVISALASSMSVPIYATGYIKNYQIIVSSIKILVLPISYLCYKLGMAPISSMYIAFFLSIFAQIARVIIWSRLTKLSGWEYSKAVLIPMLVVLLISFPLLFIFNKYINIASYFFKIVVITVISLIINIPLLFFIMLNKHQRSMILSKIKIFVK